MRAASDGLMAPEGTTPSTVTGPSFSTVTWIENLVLASICGGSNTTCSIRSAGDSVVVVVPVWPSASVTVRVTDRLPSLWNWWVTVTPLPVVPSPKFQLYELMLDPLPAIEGDPSNTH